MTSIGFLTDSNGDQYSPIVAQKFSSIIGGGLGHTVVLDAQSGSRASSIIPRLPAVLAQGPHVAIGVMIGTNDFAGMAAATEFRMSVLLPAYIATMGQIITAIENAGPKPVIFSPPTCEVPQEIHRFNRVAKALEDLCRRRRCPFFDVNELMADDACEMSAAEWAKWWRPEPADLYHLGVPVGHARLAQGFLRSQIIPGTVAGPIEIPETQCWDANQAGTNITYSDAFRAIKQTSAETGGLAIGQLGTAGKVYFELTYTAPVFVASALVGVTRGPYNLINNLASTGSDDFWYDSSGRLNTAGSPASATGKPTWDGTGDTVGVAVDAATGKVWFRAKTGAWITAADTAAVEAGNGADFTGGAGTYKPIAGLMSGAGNANLVTANFAGPFVHPVPSGFGTF